MLAIPLAVLLLLRRSEHLDWFLFAPNVHLVLAAALAASAITVAALAGITAARSGSANPVWLALGCLLTGVVFAGHGLTTPGALGQPDNEWVARLSCASVVTLTLGLAASSSPRLRRFDRFVLERRRAVLLVPSLGVTLFLAVVVRNPRVLHGASPVRHEQAFIDAISLVCLFLQGRVIQRHWPRWRLGRDVMQLSLVLAAAMSAAALFALRFGPVGRVSWWNYHGYLLAGFGGTIAAIVYRSRQERTVTNALGAAFAEDPFELISAGYSTALRSMVRAVEIKDTYTHGHSERTAQLAVRLGVRLDLPPDQLRTIACGAYLHDLGKIGIPDHILNKPGRLSDDERSIIETHPQLGYEIALPATSLRAALPVILHHHERIDGMGYPHRLAGEAVPFEARVVTVADVWDALTSKRSYRDPMPLSEALAHITAGAGTHFDPVVVGALHDVMRDEGVVVTAADAGEAETAWAAAEACHDIEDDRELVGV